MKHKITSGPKTNGCQKNMKALAYSPSGTYLVMVSQNVDHNIAVYNATTGTKVAAAKGGPDEIWSLAMKDDTTFSSVGPKHFR